jgi:hypothetical protein
MLVEYERLHISKQQVRDDLEETGYIESNAVTMRACSLEFSFHILLAGRVPEDTADRPRRDP